MKTCVLARIALVASAAAAAGKGAGRLCGRCVKRNADGTHEFSLKTDVKRHAEGRHFSLTRRLFELSQTNFELTGR